ncbi:glycerophosphodiester phosphodiesterase [Allorhodopirellula solitaria]|uniref:Glycerophosphoryl diester phosphodiesterase n=1 Tax=Allorhodopirellula solitaria TaxID=2527987 RepID=A0A5C5XRP1_9BACT|nr:glycerophosphodiester phosphodiesterase family protein [Allorhodopirellula solitaria]TWT65191.1 Glycerophosphoryl diester phosphodiesterase [Allorhodopirellula solitaria]
MDTHSYRYRIDSSLRSRLGGGQRPLHVRSAHLAVFVVLVGLFIGGRIVPCQAEPPAIDAESSAEWTAAIESVERIVAHRGSRLDRPENTMAAIERAIETGAHAVEIDVRTSRDGKLVIIHDAKVDRTTNGTGRINDLTWAELSALDAGSWFGADYASERIPSLDQVLEACKGRVQVQLDLKEEGEVYADRIQTSVSTFGEPARTVAAVQSVEQLQQLKERMPALKTLIFLRKRKLLDSFLEAKVDFLRPQVKWIAANPALLTKIRARGAKIHLDATSGTPEKVRPLLHYRPESILCDAPAKLIQTLDQLHVDE